MQPSLRSAVSARQQYLTSGSNLLLVNGLALDVGANLDFYGAPTQLLYAIVVL